MNNHNSKIKCSKNNPIIPTTKFDKLNDDRPIFIFSSFYYESIEIDGFNNKYMNMKKSINTVNHFIEKIKSLSNSKMSDINRLNHFHPIKSECEVKRIERVLKDGYMVNDIKIRSFEGTYYEIPFGDGQRIICSNVENVFEILFIDSNHMIYRESSRLLKAKQNYKCPSCFGKVDYNISYQEYDMPELINIIIDDLESGRINNIKDIIEDLKYINSDNRFPELYTPTVYNDEKDTTPVV